MPQNDGDIAAMTQVTHAAHGADGLCIWAVRIHTPEIDVAGQVMDDLVRNLPDGDPVLHVCRFEDTALRSELDRFASELFALEMKVRRVLSIIYFRSGAGREPYDLLKRDRVKPVTKDLQQAAMEAVGENQLFHLSFSDYAGLDVLPSLRIERLEAALADTTDFDDFRRALTRPPISDADDKQLIAGLKHRMDVLEKMRNCIAHNRRPPGSLRRTYPDARDELNELLDDYLSAINAV